VPLGGGNNPCTALGRHCPLEFGRAIVQNLVRFTTTFDFDGEYLWNGWRYGQVVNGIINYDPSRVEQKNLVTFGPLTATVSWLMSTYS